MTLIAVPLAFGLALWFSSLLINPMGKMVYFCLALGIAGVIAAIVGKTRRSWPRHLRYQVRLYGIMVASLALLSYVLIEFRDVFFWVHFLIAPYAVGLYLAYNVLPRAYPHLFSRDGLIYVYDGIVVGAMLVGLNTEIHWLNRGLLDPALVMPAFFFMIAGLLCWVKYMFFKSRRRKASSQH